MIFPIIQNQPQQRSFDIVGMGEVLVEFYESDQMNMNGERFYQQSVGGDVFNTLYAASLFRTSTSLLSSFGNDIFKEYIWERVAKTDVDISQFYLDFDYYNGVYFIKVTPDQNRIIQSYRERSAAHFSLNDYSYQKLFDVAKKAKIFYCTGITLAICNRKDLFIKFIKELHDAGVQIAYDTNVRPQLWGGNLKYEKETEEGILPYIDIALLTEADTFLEIGVDTEKELVDYYFAFENIKHLVTKVGKKGSNYFDRNGGEKLHVPAKENLNVVDTTGAGDAYNGGFLSGLISGKSIEECMRMGTDAASACIQVKGAINYIDVH